MNEKKPLTLAGVLMLAGKAFPLYQAKKWDALATMLRPLFPALPNDGHPRTNCQLRREWGAVLVELQLPAPLHAAGADYLAQASDVQLAMISTHVQTFAARLAACGNPTLVAPQLVVVK